jgi:hypothetical protein
VLVVSFDLGTLVPTSIELRDHRYRLVRDPQRLRNGAILTIEFGAPRLDHVQGRVAERWRVTDDIEEFHGHHTYNGEIPADGLLLEGLWEG